MRPPITHSILSRRTLLKGAAVTGAALGFGPTLHAQSTSSAVTPFKVAVPQAKLDTIMRQVKLARIPNPLGDDTWPSGMNTAWLKTLKEHLANEVRLARRGRDQPLPAGHRHGR